MTDKWKLVSRVTRREERFEGSLFTAIEHAKEKCLHPREVIAIWNVTSDYTHCVAYVSKHGAYWIRDDYLERSKEPEKDLQQILDLEDHWDIGGEG